LDSYAFVSVDDMLNRLMKSKFDPKIFGSLLSKKGYARSDVLSGQKDYESANREERIDLLERTARNLTRTYEKYKEYCWFEVLGDEIADCVNTKWFGTIFGHNRIEEKTYSLLKRALSRGSDKVIATHTIKLRGYPDFFALTKDNLVAVDAKASFTEYKRFLTQASIFKKYSDIVFLAATPGLVIEIGRKIKRGGAYGEQILKEALKELGIGLLIVDLTSRKVVQVQDIKPSKSRVLDKKEKERVMRDIRLTS